MKKKEKTNFAADIAIRIFTFIIGVLITVYGGFMLIAAFDTSLHIPSEYMSPPVYYTFGETANNHFFNWALESAAFFVSTFFFIIGLLCMIIPFTNPKNERRKNKSK